MARARSLGFVARRANRVYVRGSRPAPASIADDLGQSAIEADHVASPFDPFCRTLDGHLAAHAVEWRSSGKIRVGYDIRYLPNEQVGTRTYAVGLAQALACLPEVELTLLVREPAQASGMSGRVVTEEEWRDDVAVIHRPAQVFAPCEIKLLFGSTAHVVITYQDLIGYRIPQVFPNDAEFDGYRATSNLTLPAAQRILAYSENAASEITSEFGIPRREIAVVPLGVEAAWFARREDSDIAIRGDLTRLRRYFLSLATDFPHKNLPNLLDAYAILRSRWQGGEPPGLVLAGHMTTSRTGLYGRMQSEPMGQGLTFLGPVSAISCGSSIRTRWRWSSPRFTRDSACRPWRRWPRVRRSSRCPSPRSPRSSGMARSIPVDSRARTSRRAMESVACDEGLRDELRDRGLRRVERFRWENTARATVTRTDPQSRTRPSDHCRCAGISRIRSIAGWTGLPTCGSGDPRPGARSGPRVDGDRNVAAPSTSRSTPGSGTAGAVPSPGQPRVGLSRARTQSRVPASTHRDHSIPPEGDETRPDDRIRRRQWRGAPARLELRRLDLCTHLAAVEWTVVRSSRRLGRPNISRVSGVASVWDDDAGR